MALARRSGRPYPRLLLRGKHRQPQGVVGPQSPPELKKRTQGKIEAPRGPLDVREFFDGSTLRRDLGILRRDDVDYVVAAKGSPLADTLDRLSGFEPVDTPSERYNLYRVDLQKLAPW